MAVNNIEGFENIHNPYGLEEGAECYNIGIQHEPLVWGGQVGDHYSGAWAIPVTEAAYHPNELEGAATLAFKFAQEADGLKAQMMAYCSFFYLDQETDSWVYFL